MKFEKLTIEILKSLLNQGYNILTSNNLLTDERVVWFAKKVDNLDEYLMNVAAEEPTLLVIQEAIDDINNKELIGEIFI